MKPEAPASRRLRLDELLVERGLFASRSRARDAIGRGTVRVGGEIADKPGRTIAIDAAVEIDDPARAYVSRAALKLIAGLDCFGFDPAGCEALDIGASTGGFTQVLLERAPPMSRRLMSAMARCARRSRLIRVWPRSRG